MSEDDRNWNLTRTLGAIATARADQHARSIARDRLLQKLIADLVGVRRTIGMTQEEVAARMFTTKSVICRLESGRATRPTLRTIENYAFAVGARLEIRVSFRW